MFIRVQHSLKRAVGRHVQLTTYVHDELEVWREVVYSLANRPTHLRELEPFAPSRIGSTVASGSGMEGNAKTQRDDTLFGVPPFTKPAMHAWFLPPTLKVM